VAAQLLTASLAMLTATQWLEDRIAKVPPEIKGARILISSLGQNEKVTNE